MNTSINIKHQTNRKRNRYLRRGLQIILAGILLMCLLSTAAVPMTARAAETEPSPEVTETIVTAVEEPSVNVSDNNSIAQDDPVETEITVEEVQEEVEEETLAEEAPEETLVEEVQEEEASEETQAVNRVSSDVQEIDETTFNRIARLNLNQAASGKGTVVQETGVKQLDYAQSHIKDTIKNMFDYEITDPDHARIVIDFPRVGTYNGKSIDCRLSFYGFINMESRIPSEVAIGYSFQQGHWVFAVDSYMTQYDYYYTGDSPDHIIEMKNAFMTTIDIDCGEKVAYLNDNDVTGLVAPTSTIYVSSITYGGKTYKAFDSRSSSLDDATQNWRDNSVAIPLSGKSQIFLNNLTQDEEVERYGYSSSYIAPSTYSFAYTLPAVSLWQIDTEVVNGTITASEKEIPSFEDRTVEYRPQDGYLLDSVTVDGKTVDPASCANSYAFKEIAANHTIKVVYVAPAAPVKSVADQDGKDLQGQYVIDGDEVHYTITVRNPAGTPQEIKVTDTVPEELTISSIDNGGEIADRTIRWTLEHVAAHDTRTVGFTATVTGTDKEQIIDNTAQMQIAGYPLDSNKTTIQVERLYQITTEVLHGTITDSVNRIRQGSDVDIAYEADEGYLLDTVTIDGREIDPEDYKESYSFHNITADHTVKVVYVPVESPVKTVMQGTTNIEGQFVADGEEVTYVIEVENPAGYRENIVVKDVVSNKLEILSADHDGEIDGQTITWTLENMAPHDSVTLRFTAAAIGNDREQIVDNTADMTIEGYPLTSNKTRFFIPVKPTVTVQNKKIINTTEENITEINKKKKNVTEKNKTEINKTVTNETVTNEVTQNIGTAVLEPVQAEAVQAAPVQETVVESTTGPGPATGDDSAVMLYLSIMGAAAAAFVIWMLRTRIR